MYQVGGDHWKQWYPRSAIACSASETRTEAGPEDTEAGTEYATAMAILVLQVPAGLLPIYQK